MNPFKIAFQNVFNRNAHAQTFDDADAHPGRVFEHDAEPVEPAVNTDAFSKVPSKTPAYFVGSLYDVHNLRQRAIPTGSAIQLCGDLVLIASSPLDSMPDYVSQTDRIAKSIRGLFQKGAAFTLKVSLHAKAVALTHQRLGYRYYFAIDQYLRYGKKTKGFQCIIAGSPATHGTMVHLLVFRDGNLVSIEECNLPPATGPRFKPDYAEYLASLDVYRQQGATLTVLPPLPRPNDDSIRYDVSDIFHRPVQYLIDDPEAAPGFLTVYGFAMLVVGLALVAALGMLFQPFNAYDSAQAAFRRITATVPADVSFASSEMKIMQARRFFIEQKRPQGDYVAYATEIATFLAQPGVLIQSIALTPRHASQSGSDTPELEIVISMPRDETLPADEQAKPLQDRLSQRLAARLELFKHDTTATPAGKRLTLTIHGPLRPQP